MTWRPDPLAWTGLAVLSVLVAVGGSAGGAAEPRPLFDAHLHYSAADAERLGPEGTLERLTENGVTRAVVSGRDGEGLRGLVATAPDRIVPFLSVYRGPRDKRDWMHDRDRPAQVEAWLDAGVYRGIGELHIFAPDRDSPVLAAIVRLAAERGQFLQIHGDPAVIDRILAIEPTVTVLWAHLGTRPEPAVLRTMLTRHPDRLYRDTSVRDRRIAPEGQLKPEWRALFMDHPERFLVGVDTHWAKRWARFPRVAERIRGWLQQLPAPVAEALAFGNARRLFGSRADHPDSGE